MQHRSVLFLVVLASLPAIAEAQGSTEARLVARAGGAIPSADPAQARVGEDVQVGVALRGRDGRWLCEGPEVRIDGRTRRCGALPADMTIRWLRVEPRMQHRDLPPPNPGIPSFSNAVLTGPEHGRWLGFDTLEYDELELASSETLRVEARAIVVSEARPTERRRDTHGGAGSMWLAAEIALPGEAPLRTPSASDVDRFGLTRQVLRVSFREADDFVGWLSTYFHVPNVFGSSGPGRDHQTDRYVGADCADVLVGAARAMGTAYPYVSVAGLARVADPVGDVFLQEDDGRIVDASGAEVRLVWGRDVMRGDLLTLDYADPGDRALLPRAWDHVGALVGDGGDGVLDGSDLLRHMGHQGLVDQPLSRQGHARIRIHRLRPLPSRRARRAL